METSSGSFFIAFIFCKLLFLNKFLSFFIATL
jgi:hypothetical protein